MILVPNSVEALDALGEVLLDIGEVAEALGPLARALELAPDSADRHYRLAEGLRRAAQPAEALSHYESALTLDPSHENAAIGKGEVLVSLGRVSEALRHVERALEAFPDSRGLKFGLTWMLAFNPDPALREGDRALELAQELFSERRSVAALELMAAAQAETGRCDEARALQRTVIEQATVHERPAEVIERLERAAAWFVSTPCRVPGDLPGSEKSEWPRCKPDTAAD